jgi:copper chaperone CopZ
MIAFLSNGCTQPDVKPTIQARFQEFAGVVCRDDVESCVKIVDPVFVRAQGSDKVKGQLKLLTGLFKLGKVTEADVRVDQVIVAEDRKSAEVQFSLQSKGVWESQKPTRWVLSDGQWYLQM